MSVNFLPETFFMLLPLNIDAGAKDLYDLMEEAEDLWRCSCAVKAILWLTNELLIPIWAFPEWTTFLWTPGL